jgi:mannosyltransferase
MTFIRRHATLLALFAILLLGAGLRFYRIDAQSFWHDEGNSAGLAQRDVARIIAGAAGDIHPPGYYLLLAGWVRVFGMAGEAPYRSLSAVCGALLMVVVFAVGGALFDRRTGLLAALLVAVNPFQVYYGQEARMYALLALWSALAILALLLWIFVYARSGRIDVLASALVVLAGAGGLYTHYVFPAILLVQNLAFLGWWLAGRRKDRPGGLSSLLAWAGLQALTLALYAPWMPTALRQLSTWPSARQPYDLWDALVTTFRLLVFGATIPTEAVTLGLGCAGLFALLALWRAPEDMSSRGPLALAWLWLLVPVALMFALGLYSEAFVKFFVTAEPALALIVAHGIANVLRIAQRARGLPGVRWSSMLWAGLGAFMLVILASQTDQALRNLYFDPDYARDDYRGIAAHIRALARPDDAIVFLAPNQWEVFTFYFPDDGRLFPIARTRPLDTAAEERELQGIVAGHRRLWVLYWAEDQADPDGFVAGWLRAHTYPDGEQWYGGVRLALYGAPAALPGELGSVRDVRFGDAITLRSAALSGPPVRPGDVLALQLGWEATAPVSARYKVFVHLVDAQGKIVAQHDAEPGDTTAWVVGQEIVDNHGLLVPPDAAPGTVYELRVGLYDANSGARLRVFDGSGAPAGEWLVVTTVSIGR